MKYFRVLTLIVTLACAFKVLVSAYYSYCYIQAQNMVGIYYVGEFLAWLFVGLFFGVYYAKLRKLSPTEGEEFREI